MSGIHPICMHSTITIIAHAVFMLFSHFHYVGMSCRNRHISSTHIRYYQAATYGLKLTITPILTLTDTGEGILQNGDVAS